LWIDNVLASPEDIERMKTREQAAWVLWCLRGKKDQFVHFDEGFHRDADASEGGDPDVMIVQNLDALFRELTWIQKIGEENHKVRFEWI
jgi:hypothetical protein